MISFKKFFVVNEAKFRKSKHNTHYKDFPMFSLFYENDLSSRLGISEEELRNTLDTNLPKITEIFRNAKNEIGRMGFPSMHANVVLSDLSKIKNPHTGGNVGGLAFHSRRYMKLNYKTFIRFDLFSKEVVVHEWAHLWMFGNSKAFREAVEEIYTNLVDILPSEKIEETKFRSKNNKFRNYIQETFDQAATYSSMIEVLKGNGDYGHLESSMLDLIRYVIIEMLYELGINDPNLLQNIKKLYLNKFKELAKYASESIIYCIENEPELIEAMFDSIKKKEKYNGFTTLMWYKYYNVDFKDMPFNVGKVIDLLEIIYKENKEKSDYSISTKKESLKGEEGIYMRDYLRSLINWFDSYGLSNPDELWATAIQGFFTLPLNHRRMIIKTMMKNT